MANEKIGFQILRFILFPFARDDGIPIFLCKTRIFFDAVPEIASKHNITGQPIMCKFLSRKIYSTIRTLSRKKFVCSNCKQN
jgi:hypothetical protein